MRGSERSAGASSRFARASRRSCRSIPRLFSAPATIARRSERSSSWTSSSRTISSRSGARSPPDLEPRRDGLERKAHEVFAGHVDGDVVHRNLADGSSGRAVMGVSVEDDIRAVHADRPRQTTGSEERPDRLRLADERGRDRRVVQEDDAHVAAGNSLEARLERLHLERRLVVDPAEERHAEVGELGAWKSADEALRADDPDLALPHFENHVLPLQHADVSGLELTDD